MAQPKEDSEVPDIHQQETAAPREASSEPAGPSGSFPVSNWDRYSFVCFVGEGGMGRVYKAVDPHLRRTVALKFLRSDDQRMIGRFLQEARIQARVEHDHVCKVYEAGEVQGRPYIAMQYIEGGTLAEMSGDLTIDRKARIFQQVAEGLHAAHHLGLIHRDIKPGNIMIAATEDGDLRPYLMDFGLARVEHEKGITQTGDAVGTPLYMSPEQLCGTTETLDRRTDIYSLGVAMYEVLSGRPPFEGSTMQVFRKVLEEDPPAPRTVQPHVPEDLNTIVMKCLEKDPARRYNSARALSEDLSRYLAGEPVAARKAGAIYRISKKAKKHRAAVITAALALLGMLLLSGLWIRARWEAVEKARVAGVFGQTVREVETILRLSRLSPPHDLTADYAAVQEKMEQVQRMMQVLGPVAEASGNYALGSGYLARGDYGLALQRLQKAWDLGYRDPASAYALGLTLGKLYQQQLEAVQSEKDPQQKETRRRDAEKKYKEPAVRYLGMARGYMETPGTVEGLIAYYEKRYDRALAIAARFRSKHIWLYELDTLEGNVHLAQGRELMDRGDFDGARRFYDQAGDAFARAQEVGRSDESVYFAQAERWNSVMMLQIQKGEDPASAFREILKACSQAAKIHPDSAEAPLRLSSAYGMIGWYQLYHTGEDPRQNLQEAIRTGQEALKHSPKDTKAYYNIGIGHWRFGEYELEHGMDPSRHLQLAVEVFQGALRINPNYADPYNNMGVAYQDLARYEITRGRDPREYLRKAVEAHANAVRLQPDFSWAYNSQANAYVVAGEYEISHGLDPRETLGKAVDRYRNALRLNPNYSYAYSNMGLAYQDLGRYEAMQGRDPRMYYEKAVDANRSALRIAPNLVGVRAVIGSALTDLGEYELLSSKDPALTLKKAREEIRADIQGDPSFYGPYVTDAVISLLGGRWKLAHGRSPQQDFEDAGKSLDRAISLNSMESEPHRRKAELAQWNAEWQWKQHSAGGWKTAIDQGLQEAAHALRLNPQNADSLAIQGVLYEMLSRNQQDSARRADLVTAAKTSLTRALEINANLKREVGPVLERML